MGSPASYVATHTETAVVAAADELAQGSLETAERYLHLAEQESAQLPTNRRDHMRLLLSASRPRRAASRSDQPDRLPDDRRLPDLPAPDPL